MKFFNDKNEIILPDNILKNRLKDIYEDSLFLTKSKNFIEEFSSKKYDCENCPVQRYLNSNSKQ